jgi:hypothetical protein
VKESGEARGREANGHAPVLAEDGGFGRNARHVHHHPLAQLDRAQVITIACPGGFVVGAAIDVVEQCARNAPARDDAQIFDAVDRKRGHSYLSHRK